VSGLVPALAGILGVVVTPAVLALELLDTRQKLTFTHPPTPGGLEDTDE
jgi:hypothetical protein